MRNVALAWWVAAGLSLAFLASHRSAPPRKTVSEPVGPGPAGAVTADAVLGVTTTTTTVPAKPTREEAIAFCEIFGQYAAGVAQARNLGKSRSEADAYGLDRTPRYTAARAALDVSYSTRQQVQDIIYTSDLTVLGAQTAVRLGCLQRTIGEVPKPAPAKSSPHRKPHR